MSTFLRRAGGVALAVVSLLLMARPGFSASVLVPYGSCGWQLSALPNVGFSPRATCTPVYAPWWCDMTAGVLLEWTGGGYFLTRHVFNPGPTDIFAWIEARGPSSIEVHIDGGYSGGNFSTECPVPAAGNRISQGGWLHPGDNVITVDFVMFPASPTRAALGGFIDAQITAESNLPVPVARHSWGRLKGRYR